MNYNVDHVKIHGFYKIENENSSTLTLNEDFVNNINSNNLTKKDTENKIYKSEIAIQEKSKNKEKKIKDTSNNKKN